MIVDVAYNNGAPISGTTQVNNVAIGGNAPDYTNGTWAGGVDDADGYVIVGDTTSAGLVGRSTGGGTGIAPADVPTFWKAAGLTDQDLIDLINRLPNSAGNYTNITDARNGLAMMPFGIVSDYTGSPLGSYYLVDNYNPAIANGTITFPNHAAGHGDLNPNHVGITNIQGYLTQIYINRYDSNNVDRSDSFYLLAGNSGTLTLRQGSNSITYAFTDQAFTYSGEGSPFINLFYDSEFGSSTNGSLTIVSAASGPFNTNDPIDLSYTVTTGNTFSIGIGDVNLFYTLGVTTADQNGFEVPYGGYAGARAYEISLNVYNGLNTLKRNKLLSVFVANGLSLNVNSYVFDVTWGSGSNPSTGKAIVSVYWDGNGGNMYIAPIYTGDNNWMTSNLDIYGSLQSQDGTYLFPATFTLHSPIIHDNNNWC